MVLCEKDILDMQILKSFFNAQKSLHNSFQQKCHYCLYFSQHASSGYFENQSFFELRLLLITKIITLDAKELRIHHNHVLLHLT
jgi:hypothetical protein